MRLAAALICFASPAFSELNCILTNTACDADCVELAVSFEIDETQFVAPQDASDPPRRQVTQVQMGSDRFIAEAILFQDSTRGFYEDGVELGQRLMIVRPDGAARLTLQPANEIWVGTCEGR